MKEFKKIDPKIISVVDLTHLNPQERMHIIGNDNLKSRREFLEKLLKAGKMVGLPMLFFPSCEPEIIYQPTDEEDCPDYSACNQHLACECQSDSTASIPPKVVNIVPAKDNSFTLDPDGVEIRIDIDKAMDSSSIAGALSLTPEPSSGFDIHFYDLSNNNSGVKTSLSLITKGSNAKLQLLADTNYTVTLKGTVKDINGLYLDGNADGIGGDDFSFSFTTILKYDSCICQADCSCVGNTCSCQGYACTCVGFISYCDCQAAACPAHI
ncbi:MAG: Ig-like domain-containing protein [Bacteroidia bacterium]|nr:Ig-like domain-containing protein [Bacteroidia bacterium]